MADRTMMDDAKFIYHLDTKQLVQVAPEYAGTLLHLKAEVTINGIAHGSVAL